ADVAGRTERRVARSSGREVDRGEIGPIAVAPDLELMVAGALEEVRGAQGQEGPIPVAGLVVVEGVVSDAAPRAVEPLRLIQRAGRRARVQVLLVPRNLQLGSPVRAEHAVDDAVVEAGALMLGGRRLRAVELGVR